MKPNRPPLKQGDVLPGHILRDEYGFNAENRPIFHVDPNEVPEQLQHLIPYVERWAIPCDVTRHDYFDKQGEKAVAQFYYDVEPHTDAVDAWLDSQPEDVMDWPEAAVHFMYFMKAHGEAYQPTPEEIAESEARLAARSEEIQRKRALEQALVAFQDRDYSKFVALLKPYKDSLAGSMDAKLRFAQKKIVES